MIALHWICLSFARKTPSCCSKTFLPASIRSISDSVSTNYDAFKDYSIYGNEESILICGDGDLSFGARLSETLRDSRPNVKIIASVLESEQSHNQTFRDSEKNIGAIRESGNEVVFGIDATRLDTYFPNQHFNRIQWNFPHWKGKTNNKRNRSLMNDFFRSSSPLLSDHGQVHLALLDHQGGMRAESTSEWKSSWLTAQYAGDHDLLLTHHLDFDPFYNLSAYQFRDRPFFTGNSRRNTSHVHIYTKGGSKEIIPKEIEMYSSFTLYLSLPSALPTAANHQMDQLDDIWTIEEILDIKFIEEMVKSHVPDGIRPEVKLYRILRSPDCVDKWTVVEYNVAFFGESKAINMHLANKVKSAIEDHVQIMTKGTRRGGWPASNVIPSSVYRARGWF
jgi:hypothetical protein